MILVSGGTGFVGSGIVRELLRRGEKVAVLGRSAKKITEQFGADVEPREGDVRAPDTLGAAMQGIDVVINAVQFPGSPIENRGKGYTFEEIDLKGTRHQVDAAKAAGVRRFVYVSGVGTTPQAESARPEWYKDVKRSGDLIVENAVHNLDVCNWVAGSRPNRRGRA